MTTLKVAALAVALTGGIAAFTPSDASAQGYGYGYGHGHRGYYRPAPQPQYVHPKILRKQAQLQERFYEKYGYAPQYGHRPGRPWNHGYGYGHGSPYGHGYGHRQVQTFTFGW
jgi:hypothetical protein